MTQVHKDTTAVTAADELGAFYYRRWDSIKVSRANFDNLYRLVSRYVVPERAGYCEMVTPGISQVDDLYDSTAVHSAALLSSALHAILSSSSIRWFSYAFIDRGLNQQKTAREWAEVQARSVHRAFARSNWDAASEEAYLDVVTMGTAFTWMEEIRSRNKRFAGFHFETLPVTDYWIEEDEHGDPVVAYVLRKITRRAAEKRWGDKLSDKERKLVQTQPEGIVKILQVVEPREDVRRTVGYAAATKRPFASFWIEADTKTVLEEGGYYEFPGAVMRWSKASGETMGRSPAMRALPDIRTLNKAKELGLKAWAKVLDPPMKKRHNGVLGQVRTGPAGMTTVRHMDALAPLFDPNAFRFDVSEIKQAELKQSIEKEFFVDQLQLPPVKESKTMSATEVEIRYEQMQRILGPVMGRIKKEFLKPIAERAFRMFARARAFGPTPANVSNMVEVEFVSPFERSQRSSELAAIERLMAYIGQMAEVMPELMDRVDPDGAFDEVARALDVPPQVTRDKKEADKIRAARAQQQQMMQQLAMQMEMLKAGGKGQA